MTKTEQNTIDTLLKAVQQLREENQKFREDIKLQVNDLAAKTEKKHLPIHLEQDILRASQVAIGDAITRVLTAHDSPLTRLTRSVVDENSTELRNLISDSFTSVIRTEDFKNSIVSAFSHKVARTIISNNDGLFDKVSNELKQDAIFKSKMALATANVVDECLKERKNG